jgi:trimeric autotransporter adhesin
MLVGPLVDARGDARFARALASDRELAFFAAIESLRDGARGARGGLVDLAAEAGGAASKGGSAAAQRAPGSLALLAEAARRAFASSAVLPEFVTLLASEAEVARRAAAEGRLALPTGSGGTASPPRAAANDGDIDAAVLAVAKFDSPGDRMAIEDDPALQGLEDPGSRPASGGASSGAAAQSPARSQRSLSTTRRIDAASMRRDVGSALALVAYGADAAPPSTELALAALSFSGSRRLVGAASRRRVSARIVPASFSTHGTDDGESDVEAENEPQRLENGAAASGAAAGGARGAAPAAPHAESAASRVARLRALIISIGCARAAQSNPLLAPFFRYDPFVRRGARSAVAALALFTPLAVAAGWQRDLVLRAGAYSIGGGEAVASSAVSATASVGIAIVAALAGAAVAALGSAAVALDARARFARRFPHLAAELARRRLAEAHFASRATAQLARDVADAAAAAAAAASSKATAAAAAAAAAARSPLASSPRDADALALVAESSASPRSVGFGFIASRRVAASEGDGDGEGGDGGEYSAPASPRSAAGAAGAAAAAAAAAAPLPPPAGFPASTAAIATAGALGGAAPARAASLAAARLAAELDAAPRAMRRAPAPLLLTDGSHRAFAPDSFGEGDGPQLRELRTFRAAAAMLFCLRRADVADAEDDAAAGDALPSAEEAASRADPFTFAPTLARSRDARAVEAALAADLARVDVALAALLAEGAPSAAASAAPPAPKAEARRRAAPSTRSRRAVAPLPDEGASSPAAAAAWEGGGAGAAAEGDEDESGDASPVPLRRPRGSDSIPEAFAPRPSILRCGPHFLAARGWTLRASVALAAAWAFALGAAFIGLLFGLLYGVGAAYALLRTWAIAIALLAVVIAPAGALAATAAAFALGRTRRGAAADAAADAAGTKAAALSARIERIVIPAAAGIAAGIGPARGVAAFVQLGAAVTAVERAADAAAIASAEAALRTALDDDHDDAWASNGGGRAARKRSAARAASSSSASAAAGPSSVAAARARLLAIRFLLLRSRTLLRAYARRSRTRAAQRAIEDVEFAASEAARGDTGDAAAASSSSASPTAASNVSPLEGGEGASPARSSRSRPRSLSGESDSPSSADGGGIHAFEDGNSGSDDGDLFTRRGMTPPPHIHRLAPLGATASARSDGVGSPDSPLRDRGAR